MFSVSQMVYDVPWEPFLSSFLLKPASRALTIFGARALASELFS